jgi:hypothetical protein
MPDRFGRRYYHSHGVNDPNCDSHDPSTAEEVPRPHSTEDELDSANLVASVLEPNVTGDDAQHRPVLDIDFPARLVPSSTPGHFHLYLDGVTISWAKYRTLITALAFAGVIEEGYAAASLARGYTAVRPPGVTRPEPRQATFTVVDEEAEVTAGLAWEDTEAVNVVADLTAFAEASRPLRNAFSAIGETFNAAFAAIPEGMRASLVAAAEAEEAERRRLDVY